MNKTDFFSSNSYIFLPTKKNPKVALAVDNAELAENAFKLYNPFSKKAKLFKNLTQTAFTSFNDISQIVFRPESKEKTPFVEYMETKLNKSLVVSLYFATIHDKVVMQLQTVDGEIVGYVKYPLNDIGLLHVKNEKKAIDILSEKQILSTYLLNDEFEGMPFLLLDALDGEVGLVERNTIDEMVSGFKRDEVYRLTEHPRMIELKRSIKTNALQKYMPLVDKICQNSIEEYMLVYEHGDFTPWNIVKVSGDYIPFDFEHFVEDGLEYFDLIKYYYQTGKLLKHIDTNELIAYISEQINVKEIRELLQLFLIKEIVRNKEENEPFDFEENMLVVMEKQ